MTTALVVQFLIAREIYCADTAVAEFSFDEIPVIHCGVEQAFAGKQLKSQPEVRGPVLRHG